MTFVVPTNFRQLPPIWEMAQPFSIDDQAEVAYDTDPVLWARNHILAVLLTNPGERVMRPTYGAGLFNFVFESTDPLTEQTIIQDIQTAVGTWEPNITLQTVNFSTEPDFSGAAQLNIEFTIGTAPTVHIIGITLGGQGVEVSATPGGVLGP